MLWFHMPLTLYLSPPSRWVLSTVVKRNQHDLFCGSTSVDDAIRAGPGCPCNAGVPDLIAEGVAPEDLGPLQEQLRISPGRGLWDSYRIYI